MGTYINLGNDGFQNARRSEYVDKSGLISIVNSTLNTEKCMSCVTRCRCFGKSMAAKMLNAYYDQSCDSRSLFEDLEIANNPHFEEHLNKYPVIYLDLIDFVTEIKDNSIIEKIQQAIKKDIHKEYPDVPMEEDESLMTFLIRFREIKKQQFIFIIDEWDAIFREFDNSPEVMDEYIDWLRHMFKGSNTAKVFAGVYMTGILPIKKYKTESDLNNFIEYSMIEPRRMARYFGFTKDEVRKLSEKYGMDFDELIKWYDGYQIGDELSMFNPNSVMQAVDIGRSRSFWAGIGAFTAVANYINLNFEGLKDGIIYMLSGGHCKVDPTGFQNDMSIVRSKDDVLTMLIHLGYLSYNWHKNECYIPNKEVEGEMVNAVKENCWMTVVNSLHSSEQLLESTRSCDEQAVACVLDKAHDENTNILSYNNENSLACVLSIAYYFARNEYVVHREFSKRKGFADLVLIPRKNVDSPAIVIDLKYNQDADTVINQIKNRHYPAKVAQYVDNLLLMSINYDKDTKTHTCVIERYKGNGSKSKCVATYNSMDTDFVQYLDMDRPAEIIQGENEPSAKLFLKGTDGHCYMVKVLDKRSTLIPGQRFDLKKCFITKWVKPTLSNPTFKILVNDDALV